MEQTVVECFRVAARQVGTTGSTDQQRVAGEQTVLDPQAHRVACVAWGVDRLQAQLSDNDHLAIADPHVHKRRRTRLLHHHGHAKLPRELPGRREMVCVGVGVDQVADTQAVTGSERKVVVDLADFRIDQRGRNWSRCSRPGTTGSRQWRFVRRSSRSPWDQNSTAVQPHGGLPGTRAAGEVCLRGQGGVVSLHHTLKLLGVCSRRAGHPRAVLPGDDEPSKLL
jgi:hypothetical protein